MSGTWPVKRAVVKGVVRGVTLQLASDWIYLSVAMYEQRRKCMHGVSLHKGYCRGSHKV